MRWMLLLCAIVGSDTGRPPVADLAMIEELNQCVQVRFQTPPLSATQGGGPALGMSRIVVPSSFGKHFGPRTISRRDFEPDNDRERKAVAALESESVQVGFYLFGRAIAGSSPDMLNYRALKGPGAMTWGTIRPAWYPMAAGTPAEPAGALPDWKTVYPLAQRAMRSFADGGHGFETPLGAWWIAARPVMASQEKCLACHNSPAVGGAGPVALDQALGGVLYAFRRSGG